MLKARLYEYEMQKKEEEAAPAATPRQEVLLEEIRNLLAKQS